MKRNEKPVVLIVDAQGRGLGRQLIAGIRKEPEDVKILAVGTNTAAAAAMLKAGADEAATGENSVLVASRKADVIIGPVGMVIADSMLGEITPAMAQAVAQADAVRIMIPFNSCDNYIAGVADFNTARLIQDALGQLKKILSNWD
jgi:prephenate dehydrogenase